MEESREHPHVPGPSLWPVGLAVGVVVLLVGFIVAPSVVVVGAIITAIFAFLWIRDLTRGSELAKAPTEVKPEKRLPRAPEAQPRPRPVETGGHEKMSRPIFLEVSTLGLGGVIGGLVTLPVLGFALGPSLLKQGVKHQDVGPISDYPEGQYMITTFTSNPEQGEASRRTAFVRNNGFVQVPNNKELQPSFTIISNRCAHLGCPVAPNAVPPAKSQWKYYKDVTLIPVTPSGFGCPCHGGQYDPEGNRTAGPPVRALDRYSFSIINQHLYIGKPFSVASVTGTGENAVIHEVNYSFPGEHVKGLESWMYPIQPPH